MRTTQFAVPLVIKRLSHTLRLLITSLLLAACGSRSGTLPTTKASLPTPHVVEPTAIPPTQSRELHPVIPELEAGVEAIFRLVPDGNWAEVSAQVNQMSAAWYAHGVEVSLAGAPQATLNGLDSSLSDLAGRASAQDANGTLQAANLVGAAVADLYDVYLPPPSGDLRRLAMIERQLWLDASGGDAQVIQGDYAQLQSIWDRIAPHIRNQGGDAFADQFEASLTAQAQLIQANDSDGLKGEIGRGLELVTLLR
jgi:hypothetical protein